MMVTYYVRGGMPCREIDKAVPWPEARDWHRTYVVPNRSGSWGYRQRQKLEEEQGQKHHQAKEQEQGSRQQSSAAAVNAKDRVAGPEVAVPVVPVSTTYGSNGHALGGAETLAAAVLRKEIALADQQEIKAQQMAGELVDRAEIDRWVSDMIVRTRDTFLRIGPEQGDRLAATSNPVECAKIVTDTVMHGLEAMREWGKAQAR